MGAAAGSASVPSDDRLLLQLLERREYARAGEACDTRLRESPRDRLALYVSAAADRLQGRINEALATLTRLEAAHPGYGRLYQERGHCLVAQRDPAAAAAAFERAVALNPSLNASWQSLGVLYRMLGRPADAGRVTAALRHLAMLPRALAEAQDLLADGEAAAAEQTIRAHLTAHPEDPDAARLLALALLARGAAAEAEQLLERAVARVPADRAAHYVLATVHIQRNRHRDALAQLDSLLGEEPANRAYRTSHATALHGLGDHRRALQGYQALLEAAPDDPDLLLACGHAARALGETAAAIAAYRRAAGARPLRGEPFWCLADLKSYRFSEAERALMQGAVDDPATADDDRTYLSFALGRAFEDDGRYAESFAAYARGNALRHARGGYRREATTHALETRLAACIPPLFNTRPAGGPQDETPIFVVGMPRSGSTLVEQILASHSAVEGTMELAEMPRLAEALDGRAAAAGLEGYPAILPRLTPPELRALGERYLDATRAYRRGKRVFVDKMPNNFRHVGLIRLILPHARIIDVRREPMACCFSNYKQLYATGQTFSYDLGDLAHYYRAYVALMRHWDEVLPGTVLRVSYEELVSDLDSQVRRLLDFCNLPFEPACLAPHENARSIRTASSEQVRRPVTREGIDHWRHYEPWLGPLREQLAGAP